MSQMNQVGFDLHQGYFYIRGSNVENVARFGSTLPTSAISLYMNDDSNQCMYFGVTDSNDPTFWIGKASNQPSFYVRGSDGYVGIGTSQPRFPVDIAGDLYLSGQLRQAGCNVVIYTETVSSTFSSTDFIRKSSNVDAIGFEDSPLRDIGEAHFNSNVYVGDTLFASNLHIYDKLVVVEQTITNSERVFVDNIGTGPGLTVIQRGDIPVAEFYDDSNIALMVADGGNVGVGTSLPTRTLHVKGQMLIEDGVTIQKMGNMERVQACAGQITITQTGHHELGFILSWSLVGASELEMMEADVSFFASGPQTRSHMSFKQFINPINNDGNLPGGDFIADYRNVKFRTSQNIAYVKHEIERDGPTSVKIKAYWLSNTAVNYNVNMKVDVLMPKRLEFKDITSYYEYNGP